MNETTPKVIHIKDAPKGWTNDPQYIYIGRERTIEGKHFTGRWGNPHPVGYRCPLCSIDGSTVIHDRGKTLEFFERGLRAAMVMDPMIEAEITEWGGKTLVCFCKPQPCHGDVYVKIWDELIHRSYITVLQLGSGWAAVHLWWNTEDNPEHPFWEPWQTGFGRYATKEEAVEEAKGWAEAEDMEYRDQ